MQVAGRLVHLRGELLDQAREVTGRHRLGATGTGLTGAEWVGDAVSAPTPQGESLHYAGVAWGTDRNLQPSNFAPVLPTLSLGGRPSLPTSAKAAKAAQTHTGALAGSDAVYDAAFRRAGLLRVLDLDELFAAALNACDDTS